MRRLFSIALGLLLSVPAFAATTWNPSDKSTPISLSNGDLTANATGNVEQGVRGTASKSTGCWYFKFTPSNVSSRFTIGFASPLEDLDYTGAFGGNNGASADIRGVSFGLGALIWNNVPLTMPNIVNGTQGAIAINLNNDSPQVWATPNLAGGVWNNDVTATPDCSTAGTLGKSVFLPTYKYFPSFQGKTTESVIADFSGHIAALDAAGFNGPWDTAGGQLSTLVVNIANAPKWQQGIPYPVTKSGVSGVSIAAAGSGYTDGDIVTVSGGTKTIAAQAKVAASGGVVTAITYIIAPGAYTTTPTNPVSVTGGSGAGLTLTLSYALMPERVLAGPGLTGSTGAYNQGQALYLLTATTGGTSSATGDGPTISSCPSSGITDGSVTWKCETVVDYDTTTGAVIDTPTAYASSGGSCASGTATGCYQFGQFVKNGLKVYLQTANTNSLAHNVCASGGTAPTGTSQGTDVADGACIFAFQGFISYSSQANRIPKQTHSLGGPPGAHPGELAFNYPIMMNFWRGGAERPVYQPGQNGEADPILMWFDDDWEADAPPFCFNARGVGVASLDASSCNGTNTPHQITLTAAPGESFVDNGQIPLGFDATKGVAFYQNEAHTNSGIGYSKGGPLTIGDSGHHVTRIQWQSVQDHLFNGVAPGYGNAHVNYSVWDHCIVDVGGGDGGIILDAGNIVANCLVINRSTVAGTAGIAFKYASAAYDNTTIGNNATNGTAIIQYSSSNNFLNASLPPMRNNAMFGFPNSFASASDWSASTQFANNASDAGSSVTPFTPPFMAIPVTPSRMPGTTYSLTLGNQFVNSAFGGDFRVKNTSADIYGTGANFLYAGGIVIGDLFPGPGIFGIVRSRFDIGAAQLVTGASLSGGGWRRK